MILSISGDSLSFALLTTNDGLYHIYTRRNELRFHQEVVKISAKSLIQRVANARAATYLYLIVVWKRSIHETNSVIQLA